MSKNKSQIIMQFKVEFDQFMSNLDIEFENYDIYIQALFPFYWETGLFPL